MALARLCEAELTPLIAAILALPEVSGHAPCGSAVTANDPGHEQQTVAHLQSLLALGSLEAASFARASANVFQRLLGTGHAAFMRRIDLFDFEGAGLALHNAAPT